MARPRIKIREQTAVYHCISRTVCGFHLLEDEEKEKLLELAERQAAFCGIDLLTYALMSNHFHLLARVLFEDELSDEELLRRYRELYPDGRVPASSPPIEALESYLRKGGDRAEEWRGKLKARMGDISIFMKELKQRFSIWYNHRHDSFGTIWAERFTSVLIENEMEVLRKTAAYIDLNPVRAGICEDPADYRWCGYAAAMGGSKTARAGIARVMGVAGEEWALALKGYRLVVFGKGHCAKEGAASIDPKRVMEVLDSGGEIPLPELLRCRLSYFTAGLILGSPAFIRRSWQQARGSPVPGKETYPCSGGLGFSTLRDLGRGVVARNTPPAQSPAAAIPATPGHRRRSELEIGRLSAGS